MLKPLALLLCVLTLFTQGLTRPAAAQDAEVWLQIEALPDLATATERARAFSTLFPETAGFQTRSGWYAVLIGPYPAEDAAIRLKALIREGQIPADSFIAYASDLDSRYWPLDGALVAPDLTTAPVEPDSIETLNATPDETRQEARDSEAILTDEERMALQTAMQWFGTYAGAIDGDFGPGTRKSMAAWQEAQGLEPTGVLTSRQRATLLAAYSEETASFGFATVSDEKAGITATLPMSLVTFDRYAPPFAYYSPKDATAPQIVLISQPGDQSAFFGLYDILQSMTQVPLDGERTRGEQEFRIKGSSATTETTVFAQLKDGQIKGWMLISTPGNATRDGRILQAIESSFDASSDTALDPGMIPMDDGTRAGLVAGLEIRKPRLSRTGFFITPEGAVLTTTEAVDGCARVTVDHATVAKVTFSDAYSGLALLTPETTLAPRKVAGFPTGADRKGSEITIAGYSYEDRLPAPVLTFGTLEDVTGLNGEAGLRRLALQALPGDAGAAVLDASGAVIGMLLPAAAPGAKQLPPGTFFALSSAEIARLLTPSGVVLSPAGSPSALSPSAMTETATGMTALVSCWE